MSIVKINVIEVPRGNATMLEERFAARAGEVEHVDGFESFELLRPTEGTDRYLVVTRWRDEASFKAWTDSDAFQRGHGGNGMNDPTVGSPGAASAPLAAESGPTEGHPGAASAPLAAESGPTEGHPGAASAPEAGLSGSHVGSPGADSRGLAASGSELWGFEIVTSAARRPA